MSLTRLPPRPTFAAGLTACGLLLGGLPAFADSGAASPVRIPVDQYRLANGLEVLLHEDHTTPTVYVDVTYHVGSGNEVPGKSGFAHLFEHMMFQGSKNVGEDKHASILQTIGGRGFNGTTNFDRTNYFESVPSNQLETALWLESDRMGYMLPVLNQKALDNQRDVVRNERRMRLENAPFYPEQVAIGRTLYPEGHPYRNGVIGLHEDLEAANLDDVRAFFEKWYVPANATLLIAGDIDRAATRSLVDKWFGNFPRSAKPVAVPPPAPVLAAKNRQVVTDPLAGSRRIRYVWITPAAFAPGDYELDLVGLVLGSATGRLRRTLSIERPIARSVTAGHQTRGFSSEFHVVVDLQPEAYLEGAETIINNEINRMRFQLVQPRELKQAMAAFVAGYTSVLETVAARGQQLQFFAHHVGEADFIPKHLERYRKITPEDLRATAEKYLTDKRLEIITMPKTMTTSAGSAAAPARGGR
jgi:zinc protease